MAHLIIRLLALLAVATAVGGACPPPESKADRDAVRKTIYLVSHGWHAGIVVPRAEIPDGTWPEHEDFPDSAFLEVGWGDRDYYQSRDPGLGATIGAALLPTSSVLHVVGFNGPPEAYFPRSEVIRIDVSEPGFDLLSRHISESYARDGSGGRAPPLGRGLYGDSLFYAAHETYQLFNTSNVWSARALRAAGCPIEPPFSITVDGLMESARTFGTVVQAPPRRRR